jgi:hypothetical protein
VCITQNPIYASAAANVSSGTTAAISLINIHPRAASPIRITFKKLHIFEPLGRVFPLGETRYPGILRTKIYPSHGTCGSLHQAARNKAHVRFRHNACTLKIQFLRNQHRTPSWSISFLSSFAAMTVKRLRCSIHYHNCALKLSLACKFDQSKMDANDSHLDTVAWMLTLCTSDIMVCIFPQRLRNPPQPWNEKASPGLRIGRCSAGQPFGIRLALRVCGGGIFRSRSQVQNRLFSI